jgi:phosphosulfolactate synthase (CoM biosynthesis protein A)
MHAFSLYFQLLYIKKIIQDCNIIYMVIKKILNLEPLKQEVIQSVSTQFRASPFERALFSALNRVLLIN